MACPMKGRKRSPTEEKRRRGFPGHHPQPNAVLVAGRLAPGERIPPPRHLSPEAKEVWATTVTDLTDTGVLDRSDLQAVAGFAMVLGMVRELNAELQSQAKLDPRGYLMVRTARGTGVNPLIAARRTYLAEARLFAEQLGLTPAARGRLGINRPARREDIDEAIGPPKARLRVMRDDEP
jgi:P27 family predicted phage terminase small subunit